jgi:hypothetical protein
LVAPKVVDRIISALDDVHLSMILDDAQSLHVDRYKGLVTKIRVMEGRYERGMGRDLLNKAADLL